MNGAIVCPSGGNNRVEILRGQKSSRHCACSEWYDVTSLALGFGGAAFGLHASFTTFSKLEDIFCVDVCDGGGMQRPR